MSNWHLDILLSYYTGVLISSALAILISESISESLNYSNMQTAN